MTLVLTELTPAGIAMAADSAIVLRKGGSLIERNKRNWQKVLTVPSILAGNSYWGCIGAVTSVQFDQWLANVIR